MENVRDHITHGALFFWKNAQGKTVSCCNYKTVGTTACIGSVLTKDEYRRRHYAQNLVYEVTKELKDADYIPMLYTNADYPASNACYEKVGYVLKGEVHTVSKI